MTISLRQAQVLVVYRDLEKRHGRPPTNRELADTLGVRTPTAETFIMRLRLSGHISDQPIASVALKLLDEADWLFGAVQIANGDRQRVNGLRGRIAELLGKSFTESH
jgi:hypothetical protein